MEWNELKASKPGKELAMHLMNRYIEDSGYHKISEEYNVKVHNIRAYVSRYLSLIKSDYPELYNRYRCEILVVQTRGRGHSCEEWANIRRRYGNEDLAKYLMEYFIKFKGDLSELEDMSQLSRVTLKEKILNYIDVIKDKYPELYNTYKATEKDYTRLIRSKQYKLMNKTKKKSKRKMAKTYKEVIGEMPKSIEYETDFLMELSNCSTGHLTTRDLLTIARKMGVEVYSLGSGTKVIVN